MIIQVKGSGDSEYTIDTKEVTCTCPNFKYKCRYHTIDREERLCKHLAKVYQDSPELKPIELLRSEAPVKPSGTFPISMFDSYVTELRSLLPTVNGMIKYELVGDHFRKSPMASSLDLLICMDDIKVIDLIKSYLINMYGYTHMGTSGDTEKFLVHGWMNLNLIFCTKETWATKLMFSTTPHEELLELISKASNNGYELTRMGLKNSLTGEAVPLEDIKDIYNYI